MLRRNGNLDIWHLQQRLVLALFEVFFCSFSFVVLANGPQTWWAFMNLNRICCCGCFNLWARIIGLSFINEVFYDVLFPRSVLAEYAFSVVASVDLAQTLQSQENIFSANWQNDLTKINQRSQRLHLTSSVRSSWLIAGKLSVWEPTSMANGKSNWNRCGSNYFGPVWLENHSWQWFSFSTQSK